MKNLPASFNFITISEIINRIAPEWNLFRNRQTNKKTVFVSNNFPFLYNLKNDTSEFQTNSLALATQLCRLCTLYFLCIHLTNCTRKNRFPFIHSITSDNLFNSIFNRKQLKVLQTRSWLPREVVSRAKVLHITSHIHASRSIHSRWAKAILIVVIPLLASRQTISVVFITTTSSSMMHFIVHGCVTNKKKQTTTSKSNSIIKLIMNQVKKT